MSGAPVITRQQMVAHIGKPLTDLPPDAVWYGFWPVVHPDSLVVEDVIDANDDFSDCLFADRSGDDIVHHSGASQCAVRRNAVRVYVCTDKPTVAHALGLKPDAPHADVLCADFVHYMMSQIEKAGYSPYPDARAAHWEGETYRNGVGVSFGIVAVRAPFEAAIRPLAEELLATGRSRFGTK
ncbi:MAG: hypothetical protein Kow0059_18340 [Candidatus Sumerlaeia bacterium]